MANTRKVVRDSRTGQFVDPSEAKRRSSTTETERVPLPGKSPDKRKK
jgi:hypothetical protein